MRHIVAITGPGGSGKSHLLQSLSGRMGTLSVRNFEKELFDHAVLFVEEVCSMQELERIEIAAAKFDAIVFCACQMDVPDGVNVIKLD